MYQSHFRKWTNRLIDEFSVKEPVKDLNSTGDSFKRPSSSAESCLSYKEMPSIYKRYSDSVQGRRSQPQQQIRHNTSFEHIAKLDFVQYRHYPHHQLCAQQCTLKKKSKRPCKCHQQEHKQYCHQHQSQRTVVVQKPPIVIKQIQTVVVPSPPTIIRQFTHTYQNAGQTQIVRDVAPRVVNAVPTISRGPAVVVEGKEVVHSRSRSGSKIKFNYISPAKPMMVQSILVSDRPQLPIQQLQQPLSASKTGLHSNSPYKMLESSYKVEEQVPKIIISQPPPPSPINDEPLSQSLFSFQNEGSKMVESKKRRKIFGAREGQTAHFIEVEYPPRSNRTNMSDSVRVFNGLREIQDSSIVLNRRDGIKE